MSASIRLAGLAYACLICCVVGEIRCGERSRPSSAASMPRLLTDTWRSLVVNHRAASLRSPIASTMTPLRSPEIDARYWIPLFLASVLGTNLGDLYARGSGLGIGAGLALLALLFGLILLAQGRDSAPRAPYYWAAIVLIRTAATNIADYSAYLLHIPMALLSVALAGWLVILATIMQRKRHGATLVDALYWLAMLVAGTFGTVLGDFLSMWFSVERSAAALGLVWLMAFLIIPNSCLRAVAGYWSMVALTRTSGTAVGDWLAEGRPLSLGLFIATSFSSTAFVFSVYRASCTSRTASS